jgi:pyridoxal phosphate enzyme (YggS family)
MAAAAARAGRQLSDIHLIAVSKTFPIEAVRAAYAAGQRDFGENKVQEGLQKIARAADIQIRWHLIGHLQSNKARKAAENFTALHSVDSVDLLKRVDQAAAAARRNVTVLVQVDLALEPTKHGARVEDVPAIFAAARDCGWARVSGLMLLPPFVENAEDARPWFRQLRDIRQRLLDNGVDPAFARELSMGMSHDFEVAIEEGATMVRVGTAIFGERKQL